MNLASLSSPLEAARAYAAKGWNVFPSHGLRPRSDDDGRLACTCGDAGCRKAGMHPAPMVRGITDATTDASRIDGWWRGDAPWNVAIRTGRASGLYVLDVAASARAELQRLHAAHGLPETMLATTGAGGLHLFYRYPDDGNRWPNTRGRIAPGIDTRGELGYVVVAPSLHRNGSRYTWDLAVEPAPMPGWLLERLQPGHRSATAPTAVPTDHLADVLGDAAAVAPAPKATPEPRWRGDAFAAAKGDVEGDDVRPSLEALARELAHRGVTPDTIVWHVRRANDQNCRPALSSDAIDEVAYGALAAEHARQARESDAAGRGPVDPSTAEGQRRLAELRRAERASQGGIVPAVRAHLLATLSVLDFDATANDLGIEWHETRERVRLPVGGSERELQPAVLRYLGNLGQFAAKAHEKARAKHVIVVLQEFARHAPGRQIEQDDSEPVQLVDAILSLDVWKNEEVGGYSRPTPAMLAARKGFHESQGLGFMVDGKGREILVVHFPRLASGALSKNSQFRGKKAAELKALLAEAPGYIGAVKLREVRNRVGDLRFYGVDIGEFNRILGRDKQDDAHEVRPEAPAPAPSPTASSTLWSKPSAPSQTTWASDPAWTGD